MDGIRRFLENKNQNIDQPQNMSYNAEFKPDDHTVCKKEYYVSPKKFGDNLYNFRLLIDV